MPLKSELLAFLSTYLTEPRKNKIQEVLAFRTRHITVALEDIYQPHNASAVLRTCDCFGIQDIHVIENENSYQINPKVVMGAAKWINLHKYNKEKNNTSTCIKTLKAKGYKIVATSPHAKEYTPLNLPLEDKLALCFGTEKEGVSQELMDHADYLLQIPMFGFTESFNVSVSASLCVSRLVERLHDSTIDWQLSSEELLSLKIDWTTKSIRNGIRLRDKFLAEVDQGSTDLDE